MEIAPEAVDAPEAAPPRRFRATENPLVRAVGRIPLPLGAKLLIGFALVAGLLALSAVLGLVALSQSNSRGEELRRLQQQAVYEQQLLADTQQLQSATGLLVYSPRSAGLHSVVGADVARLVSTWPRMFAEVTRARPSPEGSPLLGSIQRWPATSTLS